MTPRRIIIGLIVFTVAVFSLVAARKLTTTPKFDRIQPGMTIDGVEAMLGEVYDVVWEVNDDGVCFFGETWDCDEGRLVVLFSNEQVVVKRISRRGALERLAWLTGWRPTPEPRLPTVPRRLARDTAWQRP